MRQAKRTVRLALACLTTAVLSGCTYFPGFTGPFAIGTSPQYIPIEEIKSQVRCEISHFLAANTGEFAKRGVRERLDPARFANISLSVKLDSSAGLTYFGIDLSFLSLENVVALVSGRPGIFARTGAKGVVTTKVDINIPQSSNYAEPDKDPPPRAKLAKAAVSRAPSVPVAAAAEANCDPEINGSLIRLGIDKWLESFIKERAEKAAAHPGPYCITKITFTSEFVIFVSLSASLHPAGITKLLAPVNLFVADFSPTHTHQLQVVLNLTDKENSALCKSGSGS